MINSEQIINLENHQDNQFSKSVIEKIEKSGDLHSNFQDLISVENVSLTRIRQNMGKKSLDYSKSEISISNLLINDYIEMGIFSPLNSDKNDKVIYFIHGGGFIGGNFFQYENQLKLIVEKAHTTIVAINYRLAPENKYPAGLLDCRIGYDWIIKNCDKYGWDRNKIFLLGDSAGVNLGLLLSINYDDVFFSSVINIYGCVDLFPEENSYYKWSIERYNIVADQQNLLASRLNKFSQQMKLFSKLYIDKEQLNSVNLFDKKDYSRISKMLYIEAEFDYFRWSNRYLIENNLSDIDVDIINFKGVDHGFFERLGFCNETLILINMISNYILEN